MFRKVLRNSFAGSAQTVIPKSFLSESQFYDFLTVIIFYPLIFVSVG